MEPKLKWQVSAERDHAWAASGALQFSILDASDGTGPREWRGFAYLVVGIDDVDVLEDAVLCSADIVEAMAECEHKAAEALKALAGGLL